MARGFNCRLESLAKPFFAEELPITRPDRERSYASDGGGYRRGSVVQGQGPRQWLWIDRTGKTSGTIHLPLNVNADLRLSPDGKQVACFEGGIDALVLGGGAADIWLYDLDRNLSTRLTTDAAPDGFPVWSPDGTRLVFSSRRGNAAAALYEKPSNAAVPEQIVSNRIGTLVFARDWRRMDGLSYLKTGFGHGSWGSLMLPSGERKPSPYLATL